jgi:hypothetical protein
MARISIDPVTRIEGHLRIDVEVDGGTVNKAWASCTMWRGLETILRGRDAREGWVFAQRFCGVCTTVHAMASVRAVEDALALDIPPNAQYIRNLILIGHALHDHIVHFYHLSALDWIDIMSIPKADPARAASIAESSSSWQGNSRRELEAVQNKVKGIVAGAAARHFFSRLLGSSRDAPEPGDESYSLRALSAGAGVSAEVLPGRGHSWWQDAAHSESRRRRGHECHQPEQPRDHEHGPPGHVAIDPRRPDPVRAAGLSRRYLPAGGFLPGMVSTMAGVSPTISPFPTCRSMRRLPNSIFPAASS